MNKLLSLPLLLAGLLLAGCNSSDATNDSADNNYTVLEGTVPGTLIEAFCEDGSYYFTHSVDDGSYYFTHSVDDGTDEHPFTLIIPKNLKCHLVMTTNEDDNITRVITPIRINTEQYGNGSLFHGLSDRADLSHIPLAMDRSDINDSTGDGVSDDLKDVPVVSGTLIPDVIADDPMDRDGDGIINLYEDDDDDGTFNREDDDDDNDGIADDHEDDSDDDGIDDAHDTDDDNDGISDEEDDH